MFVHIKHALKLQQNYVETGVCVMFQDSGRQRNYIWV